MKPFRFHREALAEAKATAEHYGAIDPRLGQRFYDTLDQLVREVCAQPTLYRPFDPPARRHFRRPFPHAIIHLDRPDQVWILAVAPFKMKPGYWKARLS
ncbi:MAG: type II toxin-antitoxin system RelE/ParE family toxin [Verrucomicrobia bacterium]|nr:type II toxin-antitoxin system RelE/ParE family toxin [Verrucomicrobiota bacterium]